MGDDRKLNYVKFGTVPIKHTGISHDDFQLQTWMRVKDRTNFQCSICDCIIKPEDNLHTHTQMGKTIERKQPDFLGKPMPSKFPWEVLGFICDNCYGESSKYDNLYYG